MCKSVKNSDYSRECLDNITILAMCGNRGTKRIILQCCYLLSGHPDHIYQDSVMHSGVGRADFSWVAHNLGKVILAAVIDTVY